MRVHSVLLRGRRAFTLVELLVVIGIIGLLAGLALPALSGARAAANAAGSQSNLLTFGKGFNIYSGNNDGKFTSGAFDHNRDGDVRDYGWVADLIQLKVTAPGKALDLGSRNKINEKVGDYMGATSKAADLKASIDDGVGRWTTEVTSDQAAPTVANTSGETFFGSDQAAKDVWNAGYNSNYATTWHFSRGDSIDSTGYDKGNKNAAAGDGPLSQDHLSTGLTTAARVALMGPARAGDGADALIVSSNSRAAIGAANGVMNDFAGKTIVKVNDLLVESFCDGMNVAFGASLSAIGGGTSSKRDGTSTDKKIHENNDIEPLHQPKESDGTGGFAPLLFADLHVERVYDTATAGVGDNAGKATTKKGDNFLGNGITRKTSGAIDQVVIDATGFNEVADVIWLHRLRSLGKPGGSANE